MTIWLQKSASIQERTSPLKFYHFRYPKADFTASNLSTKVLVPCFVLPVYVNYVKPIVLEYEHREEEEKMHA